MKHKKNLIALDKFINQALYSPKKGFYMKKNPFGSEGDFLTAPNISILFQKVIVQIAIISENNLVILGAVIKSPSSPKGFFFI